MPEMRKSITDDSLHCPICGGSSLRKVRTTPNVPYINDWQCLKCRVVFTYHETPMKRFQDPVWIGKMTKAMQTGSVKPSFMKNPLVFLKRRKRKITIPFFKGGKL